MRCPGCRSTAVRHRSERTAQGYHRFRCGDCGKQFNERSAGLLNRAQYPSDVIALVVLWRLRDKLSLRDLAEMFLIRGLVFSYEAVRDWEAKLTPALAENLRRRRKGKVGRSWYVDETYIRVRGGWRYLYRAIDRAGALVDVMLSEHRDLAAAKAFFRSAKAVTGVTPDRATTDGHDAYPRTIRTEPGRHVRHRTSRYLNNRLEQDHRGIKGRCRPMLGLKSTGSARRYCRGHETIEHILPRSPGTAWQAVIGADPSIVSECVQRLGNLCLLLEGSNRGLGRASFRDNFLSAASIIGLTCLEPSILSDPTYSLVRGGVAGPYHVIWILKSGILFSRLKKVER